MDGFVEIDTKHPLEVREMIKFIREIIAVHRSIEIGGDPISDLDNDFYNFIEKNYCLQKTKIQK